MSAIGPGSIVQAVVSRTGRFSGVTITEGAIYRVRSVFADAPGGCVVCGVGPGPIVRLDGQDNGVSPRGNERGWCVCHFRLWPPPASEELRAEPVDADVQVPA